MVHIFFVRLTRHPIHVCLHLGLHSLVSSKNPLLLLACIIFYNRLGSKKFTCFRYVKDGRQGQLVERCRRGGAQELQEKLLQHPILSWVQSALSDDYQTAATTLYKLAQEETELVTRKKVRAFILKNMYAHFTQ